MAIKYTSMNGITLFLAGALFISFSACKKDYTCTCISTVHNPWTNVITTDSTITSIHDTKNNAATKCNDLEKGYNQSPNHSVTCEL